MYREKECRKSRFLQLLTEKPLMKNVVPKIILETQFYA